jgi:type IV secretory pathway VirB4 component
MKKKVKNAGEVVIDTSKKEMNGSDIKLEKGVYNVKDYIAPPSIDRSNIDYLVVGKQYVRNFVMQGFPTQVWVGWLDTIYNSDSDIDTTLHIEPADDRQALDALTAKITQFEAQLATETEKGNIRNVTRLGDAIQGLYEERRKLERNTEKLYQVQITCNLYCSNKDELDKQTQKLDNKLRGRKIYMMPTYLRQDEGYKSVLPLGKSYMEDKYRNFNSGALTACFPFYNSEITHENGVYCGVNTSTWTPVLIDFYDRKILNNSNITVLGQAGSGKTFFVSLLTLRSALRGIRTVIIDPEGEYSKLTDAVGGSNIILSPEDNAMCINPFDIDEADVVDDDGYPTGIKTVDINGKAADVLNLIAVMAGGLEASQTSTVASIVQSLYYDRGISEEPSSLYVTDPYFDEKSGEFYHDGMKKPMPTFSDFHLKLEEFALKNGDKDILTLVNALSMFKKGGIYGMFDCYTSPQLTDLIEKPIVNFNVSKLEEGILRPIGMYVALSWTWEKFAKKNPQTKKRIVCDEAWMLVSKSMAGSEYTATFLENAARRIRKRNGGLLVASQNVSEFANSLQGQAVLKQCVTNIFLGQEATEADLLQDMFKLSDGEKLFLMGAQRGQMLVRMKGESATVQVMPFDYEKQLIEKKKLLK